MAETTASKDDPRITGLRFAKVLVWLVYAYFIVALVILTLAFFLQLFGASTTASFTEWVYRSADRVMEPFRGIFPTREIGDQGSVIDFAVAQTAWEAVAVYRDLNRVERVVHLRRI